MLFPLNDRLASCVEEKDSKLMENELIANKYLRKSQISQCYFSSETEYDYFQLFSETLND